MWTDLEERDFTASDISSTARTEDMASYEDAIEVFDEENWTFIPMPEDGKYYNIKEDEISDFDDSELIEPDLHILDVMDRLLDHPFLLIDKDDGYEIIHLSNLNKREVKDFLYPLLSELSEELASRIEDYYEDSEDMFGMVDEFTLGTWFKARQNDVELHIAEFLTLGNMIGIIKGHGPLLEKCGFEDDDEVDELGGIKDLRDKVMHGNRTLVNDRKTLEKHLDRIERAGEIVQRLRKKKAVEDYLNGEIDLSDLKAKIGAEDAKTINASEEQLREAENLADELSKISK